MTGYIGGGGMGVVYSAWDELLKRPVALKLLHRHDEKSSRSMRMLQEAAALGRLSHPNIVSIYEVLSHDSQPVLSMELVEGQDLAKWLDGRHVDPKAAAELVLKLAGGLHYAHSKGVVHRDLKPANVMLEIAPTQNATLNELPKLVPKITDFGLAKLLDETMMTNTGDMLGTPAYMAPEQATGNSKASGPSVDVYALGVILYELLTGRTPFIAENTMQTLALVQHASPVAPRVHNARVPRDLETICLKCLEKSPVDRYATASALGDDLGAFLEGRPVAARPISAIIKSYRWVGRNRILSAMMLTAVLSLCGIAIGSVIVAAREKELRLKADESLARAETSEREKTNQLNEALRAASTVAITPQVRELLKKVLRFHADSLGPIDRWTAAEVDFVDVYCVLLDQNSSELPRFLDQQIIVTKRLCDESPDEEYFHSLAARALTFRSQISSPANLEMMEQAVVHAETAMALRSDVIQLRNFAKITGIQSVMYSNVSRFEEANESNRKSLAAMEELTEQAPYAENRVQLAERLLFRAHVCCRLHPPKACGEYIDRGSKIAESLQSDPEYGERAKASVNDAKRLRDEAIALGCLGQPDPNSPENLLDKEILEATRLMNESPTDPAHYIAAAKAMSKRAALNMNIDEASPLFEMACDHTEKACELLPSDEHYELFLSILHERCKMLFHAARYDEAYTNELKWISTAETLAKQSPSPNLEFRIAQHLRSLALNGSKTNPCKPCGEQLERGIKILEPLLANPDTAKQAQALLDIIRNQYKEAADGNRL